MQPKPNLEAAGYQVVVVDYNSQDDLRFALRGIDLVVSTVSGTPQINLIDAAAHSRVRRFVPAEFEGPPSRRPTNGIDDLDRGRGRSATLDRLRHYQNRHNRHHMRSTIFICGVFYERFARGGLASKGIAIGSGIEHQGAFLMDIGQNTAEIVERNNAGHSVHLCMTSMSDVAQFLVAAMDLGLEAWPAEFRMRGDRKTTAEIVELAEFAKGAAPGTLFSTTIYEHNDLTAHLNYAQFYQDWPRVIRIQELIATADRRYDFGSANLNSLVTFTPTTFWDWLRGQWPQP